MALTDTYVWQTIPKSKPYSIRDIQGFSLHIAINGTKSWHFRYTLRRKEKGISLGNH